MPKANASIHWLFFCAEDENTSIRGPVIPVWSIWEMDILVCCLADWGQVRNRLSTFTFRLKSKMCFFEERNASK